MHHIELAHYEPASGRLFGQSVCVCMYKYIYIYIYRTRIYTKQGLAKLYISFINVTIMTTAKAFTIQIHKINPVHFNRTLISY